MRPKTAKPVKIHSEKYKAAKRREDAKKKRMKALMDRFLEVQGAAGGGIDEAGLRQVLDARVAPLFLPREKRLGFRAESYACSADAAKYVMARVTTARGGAAAYSAPVSEAPVARAVAVDLGAAAVDPGAAAPPVATVVLFVGDVAGCAVDPGARLRADDLAAVERWFSYWCAREDDVDEIFRTHDVDSSGSWSRNELWAALLAVEEARRPAKTAPIELTVEAFQHVAGEADLDVDGVLDRAEVLWALTLWDQILAEARTRKSAACAVA